jgi:hypothetical protein
VGLGQHVGRPAADERAAEARDGAERAAPVAAGGQLERRDGAVLEPAPDDGRTAGVAGQADVDDAGLRGPLLLVRCCTTAARSTGLIGSSVRRSPGVWLAGRPPASTSASDAGSPA